MTNQRGIAFVPVIAIIFAVAALGLAGWMFLKTKDTVKNTSNTNSVVACTDEAKLCPDGSYVGRTGPKCEFTACPTTNTNTNTPSNVFSFTTAKVGDHVAGMTITKIGQYKDNDTEPNYRVEFSGQATIKGNLVSDNGIGPTVVMNVTDPDYQVLLPRLDTEDRSVGFAFSNEDFALTKFPLGTDSDQTIVIDHFILNSYPSEVTNVAELVSVSSSSPTAGWKTYRNSRYGYSVQYPPEYTLSGSDEQRMISIHNYAGGNVQTVGIYYATGNNDEDFGQPGDGLAVFDWIQNARKGFPNTNYLFNRRTTVIDGRTFITYDYDLGGSGGSVHYYYVQGDSVLLIHDYPGGAGNSNFNPLQSSRILSTFTFTK